MRQALVGRRIEKLHRRDTRRHGGWIAVEGARVRQQRRLLVGEHLHDVCPTAETATGSPPPMILPMAVRSGTTPNSS